MGRNWTEAQRKRQSELIRQWQPWLKATGPRTNSGKTRSSQNSRRKVTVQDINEIAAQMLYEGGE